MQLIPAIDLHRGECVRLHQGRFDQVTRYPTDPLEVARGYRAGGAQCLHVVDLDGARAGFPAHLEIIRNIAELTGLAIQCGGGIRTAASVSQLLGAGVERVVIGSVAVEQGDAVREWMTAHGQHRFVLALDVRIDSSGTPRLATRGWETQTQLSLWQLLDDFGSAVSTVLCTDISRDGAMTGPNIALYADCVRRYPHVSFQASGGVRDAADLQRLAAIPTAAAIVGKALLQNDIRLEEVASFLQSA